MSGIRICLFDPIWDRPCAACLEWKYETNGSIKRDYKGDMVKRYGPTPCMSCPKPPTWAKAAGKPVIELRVLGESGELSDRNRQAYEAYGAYKAVLQFPDDPIVRWYSGIIRRIEDERITSAMDSAANGIDVIVEILCKRWGKR